MCKQEDVGLYCGLKRIYATYGEAFTERHWDDGEVMNMSKKLSGAVLSFVTLWMGFILKKPLAGFSRDKLKLNVSTCSPTLCFISTARKQEIIKITEQLIEAVNNGDFEAYAWVRHLYFITVAFITFTGVDFKTVMYDL